MVINIITASSALILRLKPSRFQSQPKIKVSRLQYKLQPQSSHGFVHLYLSFRIFLCLYASSQNLMVWYSLQCNCLVSVCSLGNTYRLNDGLYLFPNYILIHGEETFYEKSEQNLRFSDLKISFQKKRCTFHKKERNYQCWHYRNSLSYGCLLTITTCSRSLILVNS